jgi:hypothetical protein
MEVRTINLEEFISKLDDLGKTQVPFAVSRALTDISRVGKNNLTMQLTKNFDKPTTFTKNAAFGGAQVPKGQTFTVFGIMDRQADYLEAEVFGGARKLKPFETRFNGKFLMPTNNAPRDAYGNVPLDVVKQIMTDAKAKAKGYYVTKKQIRYRPTGGQSKAIYNIVDERPTYTPVISLEEAADEAVAAWPEAFALRFREAMRTAK